MDVPIQNVIIEEIPNSYNYPQANLEMMKRATTADYIDESTTTIALTEIKHTPINKKLGDESSLSI